MECDLGCASPPVSHFRGLHLVAHSLTCCLVYGTSVCQPQPQGPGLCWPQWSLRCKVQPTQGPPQGWSRTGDDLQTGLQGGICSWAYGVTSILHFFF